MLARAARHRVSSPPVQDAALAVVLAAVEVVSVALADDGPGTPAAGYVVLVASAVPLVWRRRAPIVVWGLVVVATLVYALEPWPDPALYATALVAVYSVAAHARLRLAIGAGTATLVLAVVGWIADPQPNDFNDLLLPMCATVAAWSLGHAAAQGRARLEAAGEARRVASRRAVDAERRRIARELHDLTAHHVSVMALQAEAGEATLPAAGVDDARRAFMVIGASARAALADLRRTLGLLREDDPALHAPQPGLADLPGLVDDIAQAGLAVDLEVDLDGSTVPLEDAVELNVYRIVQEALTNVVKHAHASRATVRVQRDRQGLELEIVDDGRGLDTARNAGFGLVGMRERVTSCNGELTVDDADPGVRVRAWFPA